MARPSETGSCPAGQAASHLDASRCDPARWAEHFRDEAELARGAQRAARNPIERAYRMGQKDALLMAADDIESGARLAMIDWRKA